MRREHQRAEEGELPLKRPLFDVRGSLSTNLDQLTQTCRRTGSRRKRIFHSLDFSADFVYSVAIETGTLLPLTSRLNHVRSPIIYRWSL